jgi:hypothetical protein
MARRGHSGVGAWVHVRWLFEPVPRGRVAALRTLSYFFVVFDLLVYTSWAVDRSSETAGLYAPLQVGRILDLPTPTSSLVHTVYWLLLTTALAAATGRAPRALGWVVFGLYFEWLIIAMSYGKVDHDRFAFLVALAVLPTAGRARHGDPTPTERAGWVMRMVQIAVVATYFLSTWAKLRFGGIGWLTGSVLARAFVRRGSDLAHLIGSVPHVLVAAQIGIVAFELLSPLVFLLRGRRLYAAIGVFYSFHLLTYVLIGISFAPHLVAVSSFLPLEKIRPLAWVRSAHSNRLRVAGRGWR